MNDENVKPRSHNMEKHSLSNHLKKKARSNFVTAPEIKAEKDDSPSDAMVERKRKLTGNTPKDSKSKLSKWHPPEEGCCHFCYTNDKTRELGELRELSDDLSAHHSCLVS